MNIYNYIFAYIFIYLSFYLAIYLLLMLEFMVDLPQEGIWKQKFLDAGGIPFACLCLGSRISCDHPGSAQGRSCGESGAGVQWWFSSCPVCSCRWKHQKRHWGALWTPPWEQITCPSTPGTAICFPSSSHTSSSSSYSSSMLWEGPLLFLVLFAWNRNIHVPALFVSSSQKRIHSHSTPFPLILHFCHQTLRAYGVVPFLKPASYAGQFRGELIWQWPGTLWLSLCLLLVCR